MQLPANKNGHMPVKTGPRKAHLGPFVGPRKSHVGAFMIGRSV